MGKLSDILSASSGGNIFNNWDSVKAADDFAPLPPGSYVCRLASGELRQAKTGTFEYVLTFKVLEGEHQGRQVWHPIYLTEAAKAMAKRDFAKLGLTSQAAIEAAIEGPLPKGIRCRVQVTLRRDDNNIERNRVRSFDVIGIDSPDVDPFAPLLMNSTGPMNPSGASGATGLPPIEGSKAEEDGSGRLSFDPSKF